MKFFSCIYLFFYCFQAQAIVVGFLASLVAMVMGWIPDGNFDIHHAFLLCASSMLTAALASFVLGQYFRCISTLVKKSHKCEQSLKLCYISD